MRASSGEAQDLADGFRQSLPSRLLLVEVALTGARDAVQTGATTIRCHAPIRGYQPRLFHAMQRRIERAFLDTEYFVGYAFNVRGNTVPVLRTPSQGLQYEEIERPLQRVGSFLSAEHHHSEV
jgi:hypothetical protein